MNYDFWFYSLIVAKDATVHYLSILMNWLVYITTHGTGGYKGTDPDIATHPVCQWDLALGQKNFTYADGKLIVIGHLIVYTTYHDNTHMGLE